MPSRASAAVDDQAARRRTRAGRSPTAGRGRSARASASSGRRGGRRSSARATARLSWVPTPSPTCSSGHVDSRDAKRPTGQPSSASRPATARRRPGHRSASGPSPASATAARPGLEPGRLDHQADAAELRGACGPQPSRPKWRRLGVSDAEAGHVDTHPGRVPAVGRPPLMWFSRSANASASGGRRSSRRGRELAPAPSPISSSGRKSSRVARIAASTTACLARFRPKRSRSVPRRPSPPRSSSGRRGRRGRPRGTRGSGSCPAGSARERVGRPGRRRRRPADRRPGRAGGRRR